MIMTYGEPKTGVVQGVPMRAPKTWFISDTHFCSNNIIKYCHRPFKDADEMNEEMVRRWNEVVQPQDTVYHLGDFVMEQSEQIPRFLERLNGHIILVRGNHETRRKLAVLAQYPEKVEIRDIAYLQYKKLFFVMCHMPMTNPDFLDMVVQDNSEVVMMHGHVHDKVPFFTPDTHSFNVSVDVIDFRPVDIDTVYEMVKRHFIEKGVWRG